MKKLSLMWLVLMLAVSVYAEKKEIHILAANDMHAQIEVFPQFAALADSLRTIDPSLLIFSAGDNRTGNPINDKYILPAYPMVALMNQVGFNGSALGNHEFDVHSLKRLIGLSNFRYICANAFPSDSSGIKLVPYQVFDVEGLRVGVIGAIQLSPNGIPSTHPDNLEGLSFKPAEEIMPQYEWLSKQCDATILLSHLGYPDDIKIAEKFPWLDLIIGGHTHTQLKGDEVKNGVLITQNRNKLHRVTYITLTVEDGKVVDKKAEYIDVRKYPKTVKVVEEMIRFYNDNPTLRKVLAIADTPFENKEELGCMICDAFMAETESEIAIENPGGVRIETLPQGDITVRDVQRILSGEATNWNQIVPGSKRGNIEVVFDNKRSATVQYCVDSILGGKDMVSPNIVAAKNSQGVIDYVEKSPNAIGVIGSNWVMDHRDTRHLTFKMNIQVMSVTNADKATPYNSYKPFQYYLLDGTYPFVRTIYAILAGAGYQLSRGFAEYCASDKGQLIVMRSGLLPYRADINLKEVNAK